MPYYQPANLVQRILRYGTTLPGYFGRTSTRKLRRRYGKRAVEDFNAILKTIGPGDIVFDLGANIGEFTEILSKTGAEVHAYEPDPDTFQKLQERFAGVSNVKLFQKAVGATAGVVHLRRVSDYSENPTRKSQASSVVFQDDRMSDEVVAEVEMLSFFDLLQNAGKDVALIKADIEGAEWDILSTLFDQGEPFGFKYLFVETHEAVDPGKKEIVEHYRQASDKLTGSYANLYWP